MTDIKLNKIEVLKHFKTNVVTFIDNLIELLPDEKDLIIVRILFETQPVETVLQNFCYYIIPARKMIETRNEDFFLKDNMIFSGINNSKVNYWKNIWESNRIDEDDKKSLWSWFDLFLKICDMYKSC